VGASGMPAGIVMLQAKVTIVSTRANDRNGKNLDFDIFFIIPYLNHSIPEEWPE
jgi:hypothetical protein